MLLDYALFFLGKLALFFFVISILTLLGSLLLYRGRPVSFSNLFFSLFAGISAVGLISSIIYTSFVTIQVVALLLLIFAFLETKLFEPQQQVENSKTTQPSIVVLGLCFTGALALIFSWSFFQYTKPGEFNHWIPAVDYLQANDYIINSFRSHFLKVSGNENYFHAINLIDASYHGPKPYHYYEMWVNVGVTSLIGGLNVVNFSLITFPAFHFLSFLGILAFWETRAPVNLWAVIISLSLLLFAGLHLFFYQYLGIESINLPVLSYRLKMAVYYPFIIAFILQFTKGMKVRAMLFLLGLSVATIVAAPGVLGGVVVFLMIMAVFKMANKKTILRSLIYVAATAFAILFFYLLSGSSGPSIREGISVNALIADLFSTESFFALLKEKSLLFVKEVCRFILIFWPFFLLIWMLRSRLRSLPNLNQMSLLFGCVLFVALCAYIAFSGQTDALQLSYNLSISIINSLFIFLCAIIIASFLAKKTTVTRERISFAVLLILIVFSGALQTKPFLKNTFFKKPFYSDTYLQEIREYFENKPEVMLGGTINGEKDFHSSFSYQVAAYSGGYHLAFMKNGAVPISLSDMEVRPNSTEEGKDLSNGVFHKYVADLKSSGDFVSVAESQLSFIKRNQIKYLILSKNGTLPRNLEAVVQRELVDELSKERFLILQ